MIHLILISVQNLKNGTVEGEILYLQQNDYNQISKYTIVLLMFISLSLELVLVIQELSLKNMTELI